MTAYLHHPTGLETGTVYRADTASGSSTPTTVYTDRAAAQPIANQYGLTGSTLRAGGTSADPGVGFYSSVQTIYLKPVTYQGVLVGSGTVTSTGAGTDPTPNPLPSSLFEQVWATPAASTTLTGTLAAWTVTSVDCTAGPGARALPAASSVAVGVAVCAKKSDTSSNALVVSRAGSDLIFGMGSGGTSKTLNLPGETAELVSNGVDRWTVRASDTPVSQLDARYNSTYAGIRNQRAIPRLKTLPALMASPPTITFSLTNVATASPTISGGVLLSAVDVPYPGTPTALSSNFTYRGGIVARQATYYAKPQQPTLSAGLSYTVAGWHYGQKIEFCYQGSGSLPSRLNVNGDLAENTYTSDSTLDGAPHARCYDFGSAAWRFLEFECAANFFGAYVGPTDSWVPAPAPSERLLVIGDSYGQSTGATAVFTGYAQTLGKLLGFGDVWSYSLGGTGLLAVNGSNPKYRDRSADWAATAATVVLIQNSINDDGSSTGALNTEMALLVPAVKAALPSAKVWMLGPAAKGGSDVASKQTRDTSFAAQAATLSVPYVSLVNPGALWSGTGRVGATTGSGNSDIMLGSDAAHPTQAGHDMIARAAAMGFAALLPSV